MLGMLLTRTSFGYLERHGDVGVARDVRKAKEPREQAVDAGDANSERSSVI